jgi:hypothetical protein
MHARDVGRPPETDGVEVSRLIPGRNHPRQRQVVGGSRQAETGLPLGALIAYISTRRDRFASASVAANLVGPYLL